MKHNISDLYRQFQQHPYVTTDTRKCKEGSIFFALKGDNFNGNLFADEALTKGCALAVIDDPDYNKGDQYVLVDNATTALQELARHHRRQHQIPVIGITGTNGKTTTKELIAAILSMKFNTHFTQGNFNNHIGVPLTLLELTGSHQIAVIEMGANHPGEIGFLCTIAEPGYGIITNIGKAHLEGFGSYENVIQTKKELYDFIISTGGKLFVNSDNDLLVALTGEATKIWYGSHQTDVDVAIVSTFPKLTVKIQTEGSSCLAETHLTGSYNLENIWAAVCIGNYFGVSLSEIKKALESYIPNNNRSQLVKTIQNTLILDMYNANPTSMLAALTEFQTSEFENKIAILGDMKELGEFTDPEHKGLLEKLDCKNFSRLLCIGESFMRISAGFPQIEFYNSSQEVISSFRNEPIVNSTVLIKGSRSMKLENLLDFL